MIRTSVHFCSFAPHHLPCLPSTRQVPEQSRGDAPHVTAVDLGKLEKVLEEMPSGLQINEAIKAKKTAARFVILTI